jgi:hypothetical protein
MALQLFKISDTTVSSPVASVDFTSIPEGYTDLMIKTSLRNTGTSNDLTLKFNGSSASQYSDRNLFGSGSAVTSGTDATNGAGLYSLINSSNYTANTFGSNEYYIPNYRSANNKSVSYESLQETNATGVYMAMYAGLWANTAAITSITFAPASGTFATNSTFTLYGVL